MIPSPDSCVEGYLVRNLSAQEWKLLDWFEGDEYDRREVICQEEDGALVEAQAYIWIHGLDFLDRTTSWDYDRFCKENLEWYLKNTVQPCRLEMEKLGWIKRE